MTVRLIGSYPLGAINIGAAGAVTVMAPMLAQFDLLLTAGIGALQADISAQLSAALSAQVSLGVQMSNPLAALKASIQAAATISASLSAGLVLPDMGISVAISANLAISAALAAKLGGIQAMLSAALEVKLPAVALAASLAANLSAGPVALLVWNGDQLVSAGGQLNSMFSAGVDGITPGDSTYAVVLVTKAPSAWASMQALFLVS